MRKARRADKFRGRWRTTDPRYLSVAGLAKFSFAGGPRGPLWSLVAAWRVLSRSKSPDCRIDDSSREFDRCRIRRGWNSKSLRKGDNFVAGSVSADVVGWGEVAGVWVFEKRGS